MHYDMTMVADTPLPIHCHGDESMTNATRTTPLSSRANASCNSAEDGMSNREAMRSYPTQQLHRCAGAGGDDGNGNDHNAKSASPQRQSPPQLSPQQPNQRLPPPLAMGRKHISLVRVSSGRHIWWMDNAAISTRRTEVMLRRRMKFLQEESENSAAAAAAASREESSGENRVVGRMEEIRQQLRQANANKSDTVMAFLDTTPETNDKKIQSNNASLNNNGPHGIISLDGRMPQNNTPVVLLSKNKQQRTYLDFGEDNIAGKTSHRSFILLAPSPKNVDVSSNSTDVDEFHIQLDRWIPSKGIVFSLTHVNDGMIDKMMEDYSPLHEESSDGYSDSTLDPIQFTMKGGESKVIYVMWNPIESGCMREVMDFDVKKGATSWQQSVVIVGEAIMSDEVVVAAVESGGLEESNHDVAEAWLLGEEAQTDHQEVAVVADVGEARLLGEAQAAAQPVADVVVQESTHIFEESNMNMISDITDSNMMSELTDSMDYSLQGGGLGLGNDKRQAGEEDLAIIDQHSASEEKKFEEDSVEAHPREAEQAAPLTENNMREDDVQQQMNTDESMGKTMWNGAMVSLELSEIEDVDDDDACDQEEDGAQYFAEGDDVVISAPNKMDVMIEAFRSSSRPVLEISGVAAVSLSAIEEANSTHSGSKSGSSRSGPNGILGFGEITEMLNDFDVLPEKPQDISGGAVELDGDEIEGMWQQATSMGQAQPSEEGSTIQQKRQQVDPLSRSKFVCCICGQTLCLCQECMRRKHMDIDAAKETEQEQQIKEPLVITSAERLQQELEVSQHTEEMENEHFLEEEMRARVVATKTLEDLLSSEGLVATGESVTNGDVIEDSVQFVMDELAHDDDERPNDNEPSSPTFGSLSSDDSIDDGSHTAPTDANNDYDVRSTRPYAPSLAECLAELQDDSIESPDKKSEPSPSDRLIFKYPNRYDNEVRYDIQHDLVNSPDNTKSDEPSPRERHIDEIEEQWHLTTKMMEQASDVDSSSEKSYESELGNTKSELNEMIDGLSELEELCEYITSPTNHDLHTQLDNINDHIDSITPPSAKMKSSGQRREPMDLMSSSSSKSCSKIDSTEMPAGKGPDSQVSIAKQKQAPLPMATPKKAAQNLYFFKQPKSNESSSNERKKKQLPAVKESNGDKKPASKRTNIPQPRSRKKKDRPTLSSTKSTKKLEVIPENHFKTPNNRSRSEQLEMIRNKLRVLSDPSDQKKLIDNAAANDSKKPRSAERRLMVPTANTPEIKLMIKKTRAAARKCYFFKSPRSNAKSRMIRSLSTNSDRSEPQSPNELFRSSKEKAKQSDAKSKITFSTPSLRPREMKALEKHISSTRERKNKDSSPLTDSDQKRERNGSFPALRTPSPREMQAYEKHIQSTRERLNKDSPHQNSTDTLWKSKTESAYDRHISRINCSSA